MAAPTEQYYHNQVLSLCRTDSRALCMRQGVADQKPCRVVNMDDGWTPVLITDGETWEECFRSMRPDTPTTPSHPDITWARATVQDAKGALNVTDADLETVRWDGILGCYFIDWQGMVLGIETDGHIHS